jgi:hypothetical protein
MEKVLRPVKRRYGWKRAAMLRNLGFLFVISLLISISAITGKTYDSKVMLVEISTSSVGKRDNNTILFQYDETDETQYFHTNIQIQVKPVNVVLLLDESSSMNNKDIESIYGNYASRMEIQKRIVRQILEYIDYASEIGIVFYGGDEIRIFSFDSDRKTLKSEIDSMVPLGDKSRGGEGLSRAIDLAVESERQCMVIIISDGLEVGQGYKLVDFIGRAVNNNIIISSALLGSKDTGQDMFEVAAKTKGRFFVIDKERDISQLVSAIVDSINGQSLENFTLSLIASSGVYIDSMTALHGDKPQERDTKLIWDYIDYKNPVAIEIEVGVKGRAIDHDLSFLETKFDLSFRNRFQAEDQNVLLDVNTIGLRFETEEEYDQRKRDEFLKKYELHIGSIATIVILVAALFVWWKTNLKRQRKKLEYHISQINLLEEKRDFESALNHVERVFLLCSKLKDDREGDFSRKYKKFTELVSQLKEEKAKAEKLLNEVNRYAEAITELAPDEFLQNSLSDFNTLKEAMGSHLRIERLAHKTSQTFEENKLTEIKDLQKELEQLREILLMDLIQVQRARDLYEQTRPTLEILLQGRNLDLDRVSAVIEDAALAPLVLNFVIATHQELKSQWNHEIKDEIKDEKKSFLEAQKLMKEGDYIRARSLLRKSLKLAQEMEQNELSEEIQKSLRECGEEIESIRSRMLSSFDEGMELYRNRLYPAAITKFSDSENSAKEINEVSRAKRARSMILRSEKGDRWEEQKEAIIEKTKEVNGIISIEWLANYVEAGSEDIDRLLKDIRDEYNKRGDENVEQYRAYRYESTPVFIDFYALSRYVFDHPGEIGGKIPPNKLEIPIDVQKELLEFMSPSRGGGR